MFTIITSVLSLLLFLFLILQHCQQQPPQNKREAILAKTRHVVRLYIALVSLTQSIAGFILAQQRTRIQDISTLSIQLRKLPELGSISLYFFVGCYLLQTSRLVSGTGDDSGRIKVRYIQMVGNVILYLGYIACSCYSWRILFLYVGSVSLLGGCAVVGLGRWLTSLVHMVPDLPPAKRGALIFRTKLISVAVALGLFLPGVYDILVFSSLFKNKGPYPVSGNMTSITVATADLLDAVPMLLLIVMMSSLLLITTSTTKARATNAGTRLIR